MKITFQGSGVDLDDNLVHYVICGENQKFKGTAEFYEHSDSFSKLAQELEKFPFESSKPVKYDADGISLNFSLADPTGNITIKFVLEDDEGNKISFSDHSVVTSALQRLGNKLKTVDFTERQVIEWTSES